MFEIDVRNGKCDLCNIIERLEGLSEVYEMIEKDTVLAKFYYYMIKGDN